MERLMKTFVRSLSVALALCASLTAVSAEVPPPPPAPPPPPPEQPVYREEGHSFGHKLLLYIPNRIFDALDIVRARVRLGPGLAFGVRATRLTDLYMGSYASVYVGLPGPRQWPKIPWPAGVESRSGLAASLADATVSGPGTGPDYSATEIGGGVHAVLVGAEVGVDPLEALDLVLGVLFIDISGDDL